MLFIDNCSTQTKLPERQCQNSVLSRQYHQHTVTFGRRYYTKFNIQGFIQESDSKPHPKETIGHIETARSDHEVMEFIRKAWYDVTATTISNCFKKSGFLNIHTDQFTVVESASEPTEETVSEIAWSTILTYLPPTSKILLLKISSMSTVKLNENR